MEITFQPTKMSVYLKIRFLKLELPPFDFCIFSSNNASYSTFKSSLCVVKGTEYNLGLFERQITHI